MATSHFPQSGVATPNVTEREGKMNSNMEILDVVFFGIAPVILVKTFLLEMNMMARLDMDEEDL